MGKKSNRKHNHSIKQKSKKIERPNKSEGKIAPHKTKIKKVKHQSPKTIAEFNSAYRTAPHNIKNKIKRQEVVAKRKGLQNHLKMKERKERKKLPASEKQQPVTIEQKQNLGEEYIDDYEEAQFDEFNQLLNDQQPVKILITTSLKPPKKIYDLLRQLMIVFHNTFYYPRRTMTLQEIYQYARTLNYTHIIIVRYSNGWEMLVKHLEGMLSVFKMVSIEHQKNIRHHAVSSEHVPELILNNFDSKVGVRVGRLLASLFPQSPEFKGRRVVTFHNQRDFIFFRHHRYIFKDDLDGVHLQQIGPRFTLRVKKVYRNDEEQNGILEFEAKDNMYVDRKAVYL